MQNTPHSWPENTLNCFPQNLRDYFQQNVIQRDDKVDLKRRVDTEYKKWKSKFVLIDLLHIPNMILKLYVFYRSLSMARNKVIPVLARATEMAVKFSYYL
jgi:hypothetical protein